MLLFRWVPPRLHFDILCGLEANTGFHPHRRGGVYNVWTPERGFNRMALSSAWPPPAWGPPWFPSLPRTKCRHQLESKTSASKCSQGVGEAPGTSTDEYTLTQDLLTIAPGAELLPGTCETREMMGGRDGGRLTGLPCWGRTTHRGDLVEGNH